MGLEIKEINELPEASAITGTELIELEQASLSVKEDLDTLFAFYLDFLDSYFDFGSDELTILTDLVVNGDLTVLGNTDFALQNYDSGWLLNEMAGAGVADWTNVHLGNDPTDPTDNLTHNLDAPLDELCVKILISTDGTEAGIVYSGSGGMSYVGTDQLGQVPMGVDNNNFIVQTGLSGCNQMLGNGGIGTPITNEAYYYKIKVWKLG